VGFDALWSHDSVPAFTELTCNVVRLGLSLREEHRLMVFESRVLMGVFGAKRDGVTGEWRRLHNEELYDLY
jgi:hypothetical protein